MNLTRANLVNSIHKKIGLPKKDCADFLEDMLGSIVEALYEEKTTKIRGFGTFFTRKKRARRGFNPKTGDLHMISERITVIFKPSEKFKEKV